MTPFPRNLQKIERVPKSLFLLRRSSKSDSAGRSVCRKSMLFIVLSQFFKENRPNSMYRREEGGSEPLSTTSFPDDPANPGNPLACCKIIVFAERIVKIRLGPTLFF